MKVVRDLAIGNAPAPLDLFYNGDLAADSTSTRYAGSLVKLMDYDDIDNGFFCTFAGLTTAMENVFGILEEAQPTSGNYLPNDATYGMVRRKITPILPTSVIRAEYGQTDAAGTATTDTSGTASSGGTTFTITITTADRMIGGWIYFVTGANAGYLHYITDNGTTTATFATAVSNAVSSSDTFLVIQPPFERALDFDATYSGIKSEIDDGSRADVVVGLNTLMSSAGTGLTTLDRDVHDGQKFTNARFYHDFLLVGNTTYNNVFVHGIKTS